jgi:cadmium resistance protein CadD (predicted permease)
MTTSEKLQVVVAALLGVFGIVMIAGVSIQALEGTSKYSMVTDGLLTGLFGILPLVGGVWLYKRVRQAATRRTIDDSEKIVLRLAKRHQGVLTVVEVTVNSTLSVEQAKETLDQLNLKGFNEMEVSDAGILVYKFHFKTR